MSKSRSKSALQPGNTPALGAYGLRIEGVEDAARLLVSVPGDWPLLRLEQGDGVAGEEGESLSDTFARLVLRDGGRIDIDRAHDSARIHVPQPLSAAELVHPYLAPIAAVRAYWHGRESFHGAAIAVDGGVWGVLGERGDGKSSLAAWFAANGGDVVSDDLVVVDGETAFTGPRSIDLRGDAAERLGVGHALGVVGARERWRVELPDRDASLPLRGWVFLAWHDELELTRLPASQRLAHLSRHRGLNVPPREPVRMLELAALPGWRYARPKEWEATGPSAARLLDALAGRQR